MRLFQGLLSPIKGIYNVVLITDMPRVLPGPAAELNATDEKSKNEKSRENAEANFTSPRRNYCTAQRLCDHSPKKDEPRFDSFQHFAFETVLRLIAPRLSDSRVKGKDCESQLVGSTIELPCRPQCAPLSLCPLLYYARHSSR